VRRGLSAVAKRLHEQRKGGRSLATARVIEVITRRGLAPVLEDAHETAFAHIGLRHALGHQREAQSCASGVDNFAEYAVPVHADAPPVMDVTFVEEHDPHVNPLGVKGVAELAMVGVAPAIANAVYHATGKRIRELPITPDKLL
jgi:hypothetical protein